MEPLPNWTSKEVDVHNSEEIPFTCASRIKESNQCTHPFRNARNMPCDNCLELPPKGIVGSEVGSAEGLVRDIGSGS